MLCLLQAGEGFEKGKYVDLSHTRVLGVRAAVLTVRPPQGGRDGERALREVLERLSELRPRRVVYSRDFPFTRRCAGAGFPPAGADLHSALAAKAAIAAAGERGGAVYVYAARLSPRVLAHLDELRHAFRHILADVGGGEGLLDRFARRHGVSVIARPAPERVQTASAAVFYDEPDREVLLSRTCVAIVPKRLWLEKIRCGFAVSGLTVRLDRRKWPTLPELFPPEPLFSAAFEAGTLLSGDVFIDRVALMEREMQACIDKCGEQLYNMCSYEQASRL